jgi:serine/threonine protein kinase
MVVDLDPSQAIRAFARPPDASSLVSENDIEQRKSKGMCIVCGQAATHEKGRLGFGGWKLLNKNEACYKQNMCPACYRQTFLVKHPSSISQEGTCHSNHVLRPISHGVPSLDDSDPSHHSRGSRSDQNSVGSAISHSTVTTRQSVATHATSTSQGSRASTASTRNSGFSATDKRSLKSSPSYFILTRLKQHIWDRRAMAIEDPMTPETFPKPQLQKLHRASRNVVVEVSDWRNTSRKFEQVYLLIKNESQPQVAYLKVDFLPPVEIPGAGCIVFCLALHRHKSGSGFQKPSPNEQSLVMIKKFAKKCFHGLCQGDSPLKDVSVLQQLGGKYTHILKCLEALEDDRYIYLVCERDRFRSLKDCSIRPPAQTQQNNSNKEDEIRQLFQQLVSAVQWVHEHGICQRNLSPDSILYTTSSPSLLLSDFTSSLLMPTSPERRHCFTKQQGLVMSLACNRRYMAPEVYHHQVFDGVAADMWSLGVILFELLTGCRLYSTPSRMDPKYCHFIVNFGLNSGDVHKQLMDRLFNSSGVGAGQASEIFDAMDAVDQLSLEARHLLADLLQEDPTSRLIPSEILKHAWLRPISP